MNMNQITPRSAAILLNVTEQTIRNYIAKGWLTPNKICKGKTFELSEVLAFRDMKKQFPERYHKQASPRKGNEL